MKAGSQTDIRQTGRLICRQACSNPIDRHTDKHIGNQYVLIFIKHQNKRIPTKHVQLISIIKRYATMYILNKFKHMCNFIMFL